MRRIGVMLGIVTAAVLFYGIASRAESRTTDKQQIIDLENGLIAATRAKNVDQMMSYYDSGDKLVVFDAIEPLQYVGAESWRKDIEGFMGAFPATVKVELTDLVVVNDGRIGFAHSIQRFTGIDKNGKRAEFTSRVTDCLEKRHGKWKIVHEHISFPADLSTGRADYNAKS
jgi:ketosteroid isomerase-like protein